MIFLLLSPGLAVQLHSAAGSLDLGSAGPLPSRGLMSTGRLDRESSQDEISIQEQKRQGPGAYQASACASFLISQWPEEVAWPNPDSARQGNTQGVRPGRRDSPGPLTPHRPSPESQTITRKDFANLKGREISIVGQETRVSRTSTETTAKALKPTTGACGVRAVLPHPGGAAPQRNSLPRA